MPSIFPGGGGDGLSSITHVVTADTLKTLNNASVVLAPAPGDGLGYRIDRIRLKRTAGGTYGTKGFFRYNPSLYIVFGDLDGAKINANSNAQNYDALLWGSRQYINGYLRVQAGDYVYSIAEVSHDVIENKPIAFGYVGTFIQSDQAKLQQLGGEFEITLFYNLYSF